jgi:glycosyltransferase involved in cell wall biosynthesis
MNCYLPGKMKPLVSVILPAYNQSQYIGECISSLLAQTFSNFELLIVEDKSTDNTVDIISSFHDSRIKVIHNAANLGLAASVNRAIKISQGEFIARMDADDVAVATRLEKQVLYLNHNKDVDIVGGMMQSFGFSKYLHVFPQDHAACKTQLLFNVCFGHPTVMFRKEIFFEENTFYEESLRQYSEEYELWCRLVDRFKFHNLADVLIYYRTYPPRIKDGAERKRKENSFTIRNNFIQQQWKPVSVERLIMHDNLSCLKKAVSLRELRNWFAWLDEMAAMNAEKPSFESGSLARELDKRRFEMHFWNTHLGLRSWWHWVSRPDKFFSPSIMQSLKLFAKSLKG